MSEAVALLERDGYGAQVMLLPDGRLRCAGCSDTHAADAVFVERVLRFEGASNPDDEAIVMGVRCPGCHQKGTLVSAYGPGADPELADALVLLERRFDGGDPESTQSAP